MKVIIWDRAIFNSGVKGLRKLVFDQPAKTLFFDICGFNSFGFEDLGLLGHTLL
jgi:hypothetical protein